MCDVSTSSRFIRYIQDIDIVFKINIGSFGFMFKVLEVFEYKILSALKKSRKHLKNRKKIMQYINKTLQKRNVWELSTLKFSVSISKG